MSEENQAIEAPQSVEDKLGEALKKLVEADTMAEHAWHEEQKSIPTPAPAAPAKERNKRTNAQIEKDADAIVAKLAFSFGMSPAEIAWAAGLGVAVVRATLPGLVESGRVIRKGEGKGATYTLPESAATPVAAGGAA